MLVQTKLFRAMVPFEFDARQMFGSMLFVCKSLRNLYLSLELKFFEFNPKHSTALIYIYRDKWKDMKGTRKKPKYAGQFSTF